MHAPSRNLAVDGDDITTHGVGKSHQSIRFLTDVDCILCYLIEEEFGSSRIGRQEEKREGKTLDFLPLSNELMYRLLLHAVCVRSRGAKTKMATRLRLDGGRYPAPSQAKNGYRPELTGTEGGKTIRLVGYYCHSTECAIRTRLGEGKLRPTR